MFLVWSFMFLLKNVLSVELSIKGEGEGEAIEMF